MKEDVFLKAQSIMQQLIDIGDIIHNLKYCLSNVKEEKRDITFSLDPLMDCHSIPITKEELISHIEGKLKYYQQELDRVRRKFDRL